MTYKFKMLDSEYWWGGCADDGTSQPFGKNSDYHADHRVTCSNQGMPMFISNKGRYIWSEEPFKIDIQNGEFVLESDHEITLTEAGTTLRDAYLSAMNSHFPFTGKVPPKEFFMTAQYNTWMEFTYNPTQKGVLEYARAIISNGFKPGILIIDEGWHHTYGDWTFDKEKFPDAKAMIDELHSLGFTVMLWVVPYVSCSGVKFISTIRKDLNLEGNSDRIFLRNENGKPAITTWWNGYSAVIDFTDEENCNYLDKQLRTLMNDYGVDGFKFDGGSMTAYTNSRVINGQYRGTSEGKYSPLRQNIAWNEFGARYKFHEYKDTYKGGGKATIQRLCDRNHHWNKDGINTIIPNSLVQGLLGHPFICPDMIGGGEWSYNVKPGFKVDEELFIRMAQVSVFFPMMQFSWAPWRVLSEKSCKYIAYLADLHTKMAPEIFEIIKASATTGEPVIRTLEYEYPHCGYEQIKDEYLCGGDILVCPIVTQGTFEKDVVIPKGKWQDEKGNVYEGGTHHIETPIDRLLWFRKVRGTKGI